MCVCECGVCICVRLSLSHWRSPLHLKCCSHAVLNRDRNCPCTVYESSYILFNYWHTFKVHPCEITGTEITWHPRAIWTVGGYRSYTTHPPSIPCPYCSPISAVCVDVAGTHAPWIEDHRKWGWVGEGGELKKTPRIVGYGKGVVTATLSMGWGPIVTVMEQEDSVLMEDGHC